MRSRSERHTYYSGPYASSRHVFDSTYEGDQPVSRGKHRRTAHDPVPDAQGAPDEGATNQYPGGKHADRPAATSTMVPENATHQEPLLRDG